MSVPITDLYEGDSFGGDEYEVEQIAHQEPVVAPTPPKPKVKQQPQPREVKTVPASPIPKAVPRKQFQTPLAQVPTKRPPPKMKTIDLPVYEEEDPEQEEEEERVPAFGQRLAGRTQQQTKKRKKEDSSSGWPLAVAGLVSGYLLGTTFSTNPQGGQLPIPLQRGPIIQRNIQPQQ